MVDYKLWDDECFECYYKFGFSVSKNYEIYCFEFVFMIIFIFFFYFSIYVIVYVRKKNSLLYKYVGLKEYYGIGGYNCKKVKFCIIRLIFLLRLFNVFCVIYWW